MRRCRVHLSPIPMSFRPLSALLVSALLVSTAPAAAQTRLDDAAVDRYIKARTADPAVAKAREAQRKELEAKIEGFRKCAEPLGMAADAAGGGAKVGLAARMAVRAKCGATSDEAWQKELAKLDAGDGVDPAVEDRLLTYFTDSTQLDGRERRAAGKRRPELEALLKDALADQATAARVLAAERRGRAGGAEDEDDDEGAAVRAAAEGLLRGMGGGRGASLLGVNGGWGYIDYLYAFTYASGASLFETPYPEGAWTRWQLVDSSAAGETVQMERALLARLADGSEWWRTKAVISRAPAGKGRAAVDTVVLEALLAPEMPRRVVRMRARLPGTGEAREMLPPEGSGLLGTQALPFRPTPESVAAATVGTEQVAGVPARRVRFGAGDGGVLEWWLSSAVPGGWVKFAGTEPAGAGLPGLSGKPATWTLLLVASGTGATSELGVVVR